jgi:LPXTG-motif cell wall-anchored protein
MFKPVLAAFAATALLASGTAALAETYTAPTAAVLTPDEAVSGILHYVPKNATFTDTYTFDFTGGGTAAAGVYKLTPNNGVTFTSVTWDGAALDLADAQTDAGANLGSVVAGHTYTLVVKGVNTNTKSQAAYSGFVSYSPAPAPLAAGLPLLLAGGALVARKRRKAVFAI